MSKKERLIDEEIAKVLERWPSGSSSESEDSDADVILLKLVMMLN